MRTSAVFAMATWMPVLSHAGIVSKWLFGPSDSPIILFFFWIPYTDTQFQGNPFSGGFKYTVGGKNWRF